MGFSVLKRQVGIAKQIDDFLDQVSEAGLIFQTGAEAFLRDDLVVFNQKKEQIIKTEHKGDALRRSLEEKLYRQTLIPESRGDVLELLENTDALLDRFKGALWQFFLEKPVICNALKQDFLELIKCSVNAVESIVRSSRAFFKDLNAVADHMHKVIYWESESDRVASRLQAAIFERNDIGLCHKIQLRDFVRHIDKIADRAEDVADRLGIYVIKRSL